MWDLRSLAGIEPAPPALETGCLNRWTAREVPGFCILEISILASGHCIKKCSGQGADFSGTHSAFRPSSRYQGQFLALLPNLFPVFSGLFLSRSVFLKLHCSTGDHL